MEKQKEKQKPKHFRSKKREEITNRSALKISLYNLFFGFMSRVRGLRSSGFDYDPSIITILNSIFYSLEVSLTLYINISQELKLDLDLSVLGETQT